MGTAFQTARPLRSVVLVERVPAGACTVMVTPWTGPSPASWSRLPLASSNLNTRRLPICWFAKVMTVVASMRTVAVAVGGSTGPTLRSGSQ